MIIGTNMLYICQIKKKYVDIYGKILRINICRYVQTQKDFHVFPEERSSVFGDLDIEYTVQVMRGKR